MQTILWFRDTGIDEVPQVGGKNASLGEMIRELTDLGIRVPDGFSVTADAYREFITFNELDKPIADILAGLDREDITDMGKRARSIRNLIHAGSFPTGQAADILEAYQQLSADANVKKAYVAVRSSATAEDLPNASFAGQQETYLMIHGDSDLLDAVKRAYASLFTTRAVSYREDMGFAHDAVALSVGVQHMVRSDTDSSGVIFTLDTETGFRDVVFINAIWGLGENIVQGRVVPDAFYVHKERLEAGFKPLVWKKLGSKEFRMVYDEAGHRVKNIPTPAKDRARFSVSDEDVLTLARWAVQIERHYSDKRGTDTPMDIEWARDGDTGELFIVQARPETVHSQLDALVSRSYTLKETGEVLTTGLAVGQKVAVGKTHLIEDPSGMESFKDGDVLVTEITDPDWEPIMKRAAAIVTERGGRTSHAAIVSRELGIPAIVGAAGALKDLPDDETVTVSTVEGETGKIYRGALKFEVKDVDLRGLERPQTSMMLNMGNPELAFKTALIPSDGVGLARMEFIFASWVGVHPLALTRYDTLPRALRRKVDELTQGYAGKTEYFVDKLAQGVGTLAAAFWPRPVILRLSDFKTNEYAHLLGGELFEPEESNPMIGWRGASRYYHPEYKEGFMLEVEAIRRVREHFGLTNLKIMVPFCRTPEEGRKVLDVLAEGGLKRGENGLEVYVMAELPSNILEAKAFAQLFDGFSIGSNDLTQLVLGIDRDGERVAALFDERNPAVKRACAMLIKEAKANGCKVGICGQAPSDYPDFAAFLVEQGIDSISLTPDSVLRTTKRVLEAERGLVSA